MFSVVNVLEFYGLLVYVRCGIAYGVGCWCVWSWVLVVGGGCAVVGFDWRLLWVLDFLICCWVYASVGLVLICFNVCGGLCCIVC